MALYCSRCGTGLPDGSRFCSNCGAAIAAPYSSPRPLVRPRVGRVIAGVCMGLSQSYGWDITVVRILTVLVFFFSVGLASVAYLACWIGIPNEPFPVPAGFPAPPAAS